MDTFKIGAERRQEKGPKASRRMRREGVVPGVLYGHGDNTPIAIREFDLMKLLVTPHVYLVELELDGKVEKVLVQEVQYHPVSDRPVHIDFYRYSEDEPIVMNIPVELVGHAVGVRAGGKLVQPVRRLKVKGLPADMPNRLDVDVSALEVDKKIVVADLAFERLSILNPPHMVVATVRSQRKMNAVVDASAPAAAAASEKK
jgi:ribosomal protein L25, ctc-form